MPRRYLLRYIDPITGFLVREEFDQHRDMIERVIELKQKGARDVKTQPIIVDQAGGP